MIHTLTFYLAFLTLGIGLPAAFGAASMAAWLYGRPIDGPSGWRQLRLGAGLCAAAPMAVAVPVVVGFYLSMDFNWLLLGALDAWLGLAAVSAAAVAVWRLWQLGRLDIRARRQAGWLMALCGSNLPAALFCGFILNRIASSYCPC
jgi:hypothetical protein